MTLVWTLLFEISIWHRRISRDNLKLIQSAVWHETPNTTLHLLLIWFFPDPLSDIPYLFPAFKKPYPSKPLYKNIYTYTDLSQEFEFSTRTKSSIKSHFLFDKSVSNCQVGGVLAALLRDWQWALHVVRKVFLSDMFTAFTTLSHSLTDPRNAWK